MNLSEYSFFNPSPNLREMVILKSISENQDISQESLARVANVVPSMINKYMKDFEDKGYVFKMGENRRRMSYLLTQEGKEKLQYLIVSYLREVARLYSGSRDIFGEVLDELRYHELDGILLYGAGIIGSILADVFRTEGMGIVGFVDDSPLKQNEVFYDLKVYRPEDVAGLDYGAVVITSFSHARHIGERARSFRMKNVSAFEISDAGKVSIRFLE